MELTQDKINLIENCIRTNRKFANNEDLYDDFFNETCKRSLPIISTATKDTKLEAYLKKVATSSILNVLKDSGRLRRARQGFVSIKEVPLTTAEPVRNNPYADVVVEYEPIDFDNGPEDVAVKNEVLRSVIDSLRKVDAEDKSQKYLEIFKLRYQDGMTQSEIASVIGISQSEVSKRLFKLMDRIKSTFC